MKSIRGLALVYIVMTILFLVVILAAAAFMAGPLSKRVKAVETGKTLDAAISAVIGFAATKGRLPTTAEFVSAVRKADDAWGNALVFIPDASMTTVPVGSTEAICRLKTTGITITTAGAPVPNVAFLILSRGPNLNNQTGAVAAAAISVPDGDTVIDSYAGNGVYDIPGPARPEVFDDIVRWVTLDDLKSRLGCSGPTQGRLKILNNELPSVCSGQAYNATLYSDGGVLPCLPWSYTALPAGLTMAPATGVISGSVSAPGVYPVTFTRTDSGGNTVQKILNLNVRACPSWMGGFDSASSPGGTLSGGAAIGGSGAAGTASALALIGVSPSFIPTDQGGAGYPKFSFEQNQAFSITAWVKLTQFPTSPPASFIYPFVSKPGTGAQMSGYYLELHSSAFNPPNTSGRHRIAFRLIGDAGGSQTITVYNTTNITTLNAWYHVAASYSGSGLASGVRIYVNGASGKTAYQDTLGARSIINTNPLTVGYYSAPAAWNSVYNSIYIDEVHMYGAEVRRLGAARVGGGIVMSPSITGTSERINCGTVCEAFYPKGAQVTLSAYPSPGSSFTGWSGGGCSGTGACTVTLGDDINVTATFTP